MAVQRRPRGVVFREEVQRLREDTLHLEIGSRTKRPSEFWTKNLFTRSLSHIVGVVRGKTRLIEASNSACLRVMPSARVRIAATKQTSADTWSSNVWSGTSPVAERVLLAAETNPVEVELKPLGYDADDAIVVLAGFNYIEVKGEFTQCKYKTHNAGSHGTIYIVSFYTDLAI